MYLVKRITTEPRTAFRVQVAQQDGDDAGLAIGGTFYFEPAGQDGDQAQMSEHAARAIMDDPGLAVHFTCQPALPSRAPAAEPAADTSAAEPAQDGAVATKKRGGRKTKATT